jgi:predicted NACHT family NTPase
VATPFPVYVALRCITSSDDEPSDAVLTNAAMASIGNTTNTRELKHVIAARLDDAYLILDGLDEIPGRDEHSEVGVSRVMAHLQYLMQAHPKMRLLVTCRDYDYHSDNRLRLGEVPLLSLSLFAPEQVTAAVERWHRAAADMASRYNCNTFDPTDRAAYLLSTFSMDRDLAELARVPLLLNIMQVVFGQDERLPRSVGRLCDRAIRFLILEVDHCPVCGLLRSRSRTGSQAVQKAPRRS